MYIHCMNVCWNTLHIHAGLNFSLSAKEAEQLLVKPSVMQYVHYFQLQGEKDTQQTTEFK